MLIAIVGGRLQGVEALYLAKKAGYETLLIDRDAEPIAMGLADHFLQFEFGKDSPFPSKSHEIGVILPAVEDDDVLEVLRVWADADSIPLIFDAEAYSVTRSKRRSDVLFHKLGLMRPKNWPDCQPPVIMKPDGASGSRGVKMLMSEEEVQHCLASKGSRDDLVIQEYLPGPSCSIEIVGQPGRYFPLQITDLSMAEDYDCCGVRAPSSVDEEQAGKIRNMSVSIAEALQLRGIMDLEVILHDGEPKILEVDARLPSQTPIAVYWSTGVNMVEALVELKTDSRYSMKIHEERHVFLEHLEVCDRQIYFVGEHIMTQHGKLKVMRNFFGADEAVTSYSAEKTRWAATMIFTADTAEELMEIRVSCHEQIKRIVKRF